MDGFYHREIKNDNFSHKKKEFKNGHSSKVNDGRVRRKERS